MFSLAPNPLYKSFMESPLSYLEIEEENNEALFNLKIKEAIHLLLKVTPELKDIYSTLTNPAKLTLKHL